jgi:hypothetical protein
VSLLSRSIPIIGLLAGLTSFAVASPITFTNFAYPAGTVPAGSNGVATFASGINNAGQVVGWYEYQISDQYVLSGFL